MRKVVVTKSFIAIIALLTAITPLATDIYLVAFPEISKFYNTSINNIEISLSIYMLGYGLAQIIGGAFADKHGRKLFIILGIAMFAIGSIAIIFTSSIEYFWFYRVIQALGGGFIGVNSIAMVRDLFKGKQAARVMTIVTLVMMLAPIVAPVIGTAIINFVSWQYIFLFLAVYSIVIVFFTIKLPETSSKDSQSKMIQKYKTVLSDKLVLLLVIAGSFGFSGLFIFITKSSYIYMQYFKLSENQFTIVYVGTIMMFVLFGALNMKLLKKYTIYSMVKIGLTFQIIAAILLIALNSVHNLYSVAILMMLYIGSLGFIASNIISLVLEKFQKLSGTANAVNGVMNSLFSAIIPFIVSSFHSESLLFAFIMMFLVSLLPYLIFLVYKKDIHKLQHHNL